MTLEIETRWGETLLDVTHVDGGSFTLVHTILVDDGVLVAPPAGRVGHVDYEVREITRPARSIPFARESAHPIVPYLAAALLAHVGLWAIAKTTSPPEPEVVKIEPRPRLVARIASASSQTAPVPDDRARDRVADTKAAGVGRAAPGAAGRTGIRSPKQRGHVAVQNTGEVMQLSQAAVVMRARRAGVLGSTQVLEDTIANMAGTEKITSALDGITVNGNAGGAGDSAGTSGSTLGDAGTGGGGTNWGALGAGRTGTISNGTSMGQRWGGSVAPISPDRGWHDGGYVWYPRQRLGRDRAPYVTVCPKDTKCTVDGDLGKAVVRRHVKRALSALSYCYEKELLTKPVIAGDVRVSFEIREGAVHDVFTTGFDPGVTACVQSRFEALSFTTGNALVEYVLRYARA